MTFSPIKQLDYEIANAQPISIRVSGAGQRAIRQRHPWLFEQAVEQQNKAGSAGDIAVMYDRKRKFAAVGLYDPNSPIRVRILATGKPVTIDESWIKEQFEKAAELRSGIDRSTTNGYRLVHGENDGLPGLIVDLYDRVAVIKIYTCAWVPWLPWILRGLNHTVDVDRVILRLGRAVAEQGPSLRGLYDGMTIGGIESDGPVTFMENGLIFEVDPAAGQKTGFFLDQRENRQRVEKFAMGKTVLNIFAYSGGFSLYAARGGARHVTSLDISEPALLSAVRNFELNQTDEHVAAAVHETLAGDAFDLLGQMAGAGRMFDLVVVDPPAFASSGSQVEKAIAAYRQLAKLAVNVTEPGGMLVAASCSSRVTAREFFEAVHRGAAEAGRRLNEIERTEHAVDHPITFKEGAYLKCLYATVES